MKKMMQQAAAWWWFQGLARTQRDEVLLAFLAHQLKVKLGPLLAAGKAPPPATPDATPQQTSPQPPTNQVERNAEWVREYFRQQCERPDDPVEGGN